MYGLRNMALALIVALLASLAFFCVDWEPPGSYGAGEMDSPVSAMALSALRGEQKPLSSRAGRRLRTQLRTLIRRALRAIRSRPCGFHGRCAALRRMLLAMPGAPGGLFCYIYINRPQMAPP